MSHYRLYVIVCDECGLPIEWEQRAENLIDARKNATAHGWFVKGKLSLCPEHRPASTTGSTE